MLWRVPGAGQHPGQGKRIVRNSRQRCRRLRRETNWWSQSWIDSVEPRWRWFPVSTRYRSRGVSPHPRRHGLNQGSWEVRSCPDRSAVWFGESGAVADSGAHLGVDPAPEETGGNLGGRPKPNPEKERLVLRIREEGAPIGRSGTRPA